MGLYIKNIKIIASTTETTEFHYVRTAVSRANSLVFVFSYLIFILHYKSVKPRDIYSFF
jgi:hypothetical protein